MPSDEIRWDSIVSARDGTPAVRVQWDDKAGQLTPEEARRCAECVMAAALAAEADAFLFEWFTQTLGLDLEKAGVVLREFREWRRRREADKGTAC